LRQVDKHEEDRVTRALAEALRRVFGENEKSGRFIDVSRIPLICQNISGIHDTLRDIKEKLDDDFVTKEAFTPYRNGINVVAGLVLTAVVGAILSLVIQS
jgi:tetrahydromethanopterin S-methyltransferase subunit B